jgi:hypothetical protein
LYAARYIQNCYRTKSFSSEVLPKNCYVINNDPPEFDFEPIIKEAQRIFHQTCPDEGLTFFIIERFVFLYFFKNVYFL